MRAYRFTRRLVPALGCLLLTGIPGRPCLAQPPLIRFEYLSVENGLSHNEVNCIAEDSLGYLWIGTPDGLNRFDGYSFTIFRHTTTDTSSLSDSYISALLIDRRGTVWAGTRTGGLNRYDPSRGNFVKFRYRPGDSGSIGEGTIVDVYEDSSDQIWVATNLGGLSKFHPGSESFTRYQSDSSNPFSPKSNNLGPMYDNGKGTLWVGSWASGLYAFDKAGEMFVQYGGNVRDFSDTAVPGVISILPAGDGRLWTGTRRQLNLFDPKTGRFTTVRLDKSRPTLISKNVTSLLIDRFGVFWVGTFFDGLITVDPRIRSGTNYRQYNYDRDRRLEGWIPNSHIADIHEDRRGNVWIGTNDGLLKASRNRNRFRHIRHVPEDASSPFDDRVSTVFVDSHDRLWIGTEGGLIGYDRVKGTAVNYVPIPGDTCSIGSGWVNSIAEDETGTLWLAVGGQGLNRFKPAGGGSDRCRFLRIKNQAGRHRDLESNWTHAFLKQAAGEIWVGTIFGAFAFDPHIIDPDDMMFRHLSQFEHESISGFQRTRDGTLWVGTHNAGLYKITDRPEQVIRVRYDPADPASVGNDRIRALHEDDRGNFWVGTSGGGLWRVEQSSGRSRSYTETDGLAGNAVEGIVSDGSGALWVSTNNGLSCFDPATDRFRTYRQIDGLPTNRFRGDGARTRTGELVFGTAADGIVIFHPDSLGDDARPPGVFITVLNTYGSDVNALPHGGDRSGLVLPHSQRSFTIEYLALDCTAPEKNLYFHKLDGFNAEWVPAGTRRSVTYRNLEPGEYAFHVKGSNSDGVWAEASAPLRLTILPPYWRTWWFYTLSGAFVTGLLFSAHKYRLRKALEMERLRIRIASDLHDDLGSNLSGIALLTDLVGDQLTPGAERDRLAFVSRTARQMADTLKDLVWTINPGNDTFDNLALRMKDTAATLLNGIDHTFVGAERPLPLKLPIEARRNLYLTYKEILHNIVKHSKAGRVEITFAETGGRLVLTVADDGVGFRQEDVVSGSGLGNIRARARAAGGEAVVDSRPGGGTRISVDIKIP